MRRAERAERIGTILDELYPSPPIPLEHVDPFTLLVAVMLSAQATDKKVNEITPALFARARTPQAMAALEVPEILAIIRPIGLSPTKSRNLSSMSSQLLSRHAGVVPRDLDALMTLPGVGRKTAQVVQAQAFGIPAFPVDTHIFRCARRWKLTRGTSVDAVEADLRKAFPSSTWNRRHLQIIYFGRQYCPARTHDPAVCPICSWAADG